MSEFRFLERAIQRGALVNYAGFIAGKAIIFANTVVLARLLAPEHFGLVAIGLLVLSISDAVTEAGTGAAVVWRRGQLETTIAVALSLALISSAVMTLFIILLASPIADFFDEPEAADIVRVLAVCVLLSSVTGVFSAILQRHLQFGRRLVPEIARAGIKGAVGIPMALAGFGVWSLVYSHVAALFIGLLLSAWLSGWAPRLSLSRPVVRDILPYSLHIAAIGLLGLATKKLDIVIIGHRFPADVLGYYTVAFMLVELVILGICWSASQALFPALSQTSQDPARLRLVYSRGLSILLAVTVPIAVGMSVVAEPFILTLYGEKWAPSVQLMQILAFYSLAYSVGFNLGDIYKATGQPHILSWINVANLLLAAPILLLGAQWGVVGIAAGQVVVATIISTVNWIVAKRLVGVGLDVLLSALRAPVLAAMVAALACAVANHLIIDRGDELFRLFLLTAVGAVSYVSLLLILNPVFLPILRGKTCVPATTPGGADDEK